MAFPIAQKERRLREAYDRVTNRKFVCILFQYFAGRSFFGPRVMLHTIQYCPFSRAKGMQMKKYVACVTPYPDYGNKTLTFN